MNKLQPYTLSDVPQLQDLYNGSYEFAKRVGDLDWIYPFPAEQLREYIDDGELYGISDKSDILQSSVRLSEGTLGNVLNLGKLAVARDGAIPDFTRRILLPAVQEMAISLGKDTISLTCLAHNAKLVNFYESLSFREIDEHPAQADAGYDVIVKEMIKLF